MKPEVPFIQRLIGTHGISRSIDLFRAMPIQSKNWWRLACAPSRTELYYTVWILRFSCAPSSIPGSSLLQSLVISNEIIYMTLAQRTDCHDCRVQAIVPASQTMRRRKGWLMRSRHGEGASWWLVWCMRKRLCGKWYSLGKSITYHTKNTLLTFYDHSQ